MADTAAWHWWKSALDGRPGAVTDKPELGFYRLPESGLPVAITDDGDEIAVDVDGDLIEDPSEIIRIWRGCRDHPVTYERWVIRDKTKMWPGMPEKAADATPGPGDNSGDLDEFQRMRAELTNEVAESEAFATKHPIKSKDEADRIQDWADRIGKAAREADAKRKAETEFLRRQVDEINTKYNAVINPALAQSKKLGALAQGWAAAEAERQRRIAQEEVDAKWREEQEKRKAEEEAAAKERAAAAPIADDLGFDLPEAPKPTPIPEPPRPVVAAPKVMVGGGVTGRRTGVKAAAQTATIMDLKAAAAYFAEQKHPELVELIQALANRAIKARAKMPGIRFSWETD